VTLALLSVANTCVGVPVSRPCAAHEMEDPSLMRAPLFYCHYNGAHGTVTMGPFRAHAQEVLSPTSRTLLGMQVLLTCQAATRPAMRAITEMGFNLTVTHYAPNGTDALPLPYVGLAGHDRFEIFFPSPSPPPRPPTIPPPSVPPSPPSPPTPPPHSPPAAPPFVGCVGTQGPGGSNGLRQIHTPHSGVQVVYCEYTGSITWTLVSRIASNSIRHMAIGTYGSLTSRDQGSPWKLSDADINDLKETSTLRNPYKFYCSQYARGRATQYFTKACDFDASAALASAGGQESFSSPCYSSCSSVSATSCSSGYADHNDCGLGQHAGTNSYASYGWHFCRGGATSSSFNFATGPEPSSSSSLGCGNNAASNGHGHLWIGHAV